MVALQHLNWVWVDSTKIIKAIGSYKTAVTSAKESKDFFLRRAKGTLTRELTYFLRIRRSVFDVYGTKRGHLVLEAQEHYPELYRELLLATWDVDAYKSLELLTTMDDRVLCSQDTVEFINRWT